ncbi:hypothetical protein WICPIJ_006652 [Wickerhamomyces pijperi]|uniref:Uncharacterized protein n=1 Tax=Wickerhamomyces pijperi TaxID=599730 RepID=A0A9P8Q1R1_WICPI|nr:hypothetical protein WICPIJ_006652 [Wickerhamomyces pijperi]
MSRIGLARLALIFADGDLLPIVPPMIDRGISSTKRKNTRSTTVPKGKAFEESLAQTTQFKIKTETNTVNGSVAPNIICFLRSTLSVLLFVKFL